MEQYATPILVVLSGLVTLQSSCPSWSDSIKYRRSPGLMTFRKMSDLQALMIEGLPPAVFGEHGYAVNSVYVEFLHFSFAACAAFLQH